MDLFAEQLLMEPSIKLLSELLLHLVNVTEQLLGESCSCMPSLLLAIIEDERD